MGGGGVKLPNTKKEKKNIWCGLGSQVVVFQICEPNTRKVKRTHLVGGRGWWFVKLFMLVNPTPQKKKKTW
jgi:hypothetical protein